MSNSLNDFLNNFYFHYPMVAVAIIDSENWEMANIGLTADTD